MRAGDALRLATIAPSSDFLLTLAKLVLQGYPLDTNITADMPPLHRWTILLPTRRATRRFQQLLHQVAGRKSLLLPRILPIGDLDEDLVLAASGEGDLPPAMSGQARIFALIGFIDEWARNNSHLQLADELLQSGSRAQALATSLGQLLDHVEEEGLILASVVDLYLIDLAAHREAVLGLLDVIRVQLPELMQAKNVVDVRARRNHLIRLTASQITATAAHGPIIAAGSTGTIAATRVLLKAIASHPQGAVILPGLDKGLSDADWAAVDAQHPQHAMKQLLAWLKAEPSAVTELADRDPARSWLLRETLRPSLTTDQWHEQLFGKRAIAEAGIAGVHYVAAPDRQAEALSIALILRRVLETPNQTAALITPDRELARRVKVELQRWHITIDDTAGEPLIRFAGASLVALLIACVKDNFSAISLVNLFAHPRCQASYDRTTFQRIAGNLEVAVLRQQSLPPGLAGLDQGLARMLNARQAGLRLTKAASALSDEDWQELASFIAILTAILRPLAAASVASLQDHCSLVQTTLRALAPALDWAQPENAALAETFANVMADAAFFPVGSFAKAAEAILAALRATLYRAPFAAHPRLAILGLLEARLMRADVVVLGGLNEGRWPAPPDPGPWLNRPMRDQLGLQQPEREIGQTAHDFVQALGNTTTYLTWSQRIDHAPAIPTRWILRLLTILNAMGIATENLQDQLVLQVAANLDEPTIITPLAKPLPRPPHSVRPRHFSVTEVERLIRDPYFIFAKRILAVEPLAPIDQDPDAALRGQLFHAAISAWHAQRPFASTLVATQKLLAAGEEVFQVFRSDVEIMHFWWPRFVRMAHWLASVDAELHHDTFHGYSEVKGLLQFQSAGVPHSLSARVDRLDILNDGTVRVIDYKTGTVPSSSQVDTGLSPQLTLQVAMVANGAFTDLQPAKTSEIIYVRINGGEPAGELTRPGYAGKTKFDIVLKASAHLEGFVKLLSAYQLESTPYIPRHAVEKDDDETTYDHLSRFLEWTLAGTP